MKAITNTELIERRAQWGRRIAPVTMLLLIGGLITNFLSINNPEYFRITLGLLFFGFISAIISSHLVNNWVREPRADQTLTQLLKKFGNDYILFNYTGPVPHVLIAPDGLYVILVKNQDGKITADGRRISQKFTIRRLLRFFGDEGLGAPIPDAENKAQKLKKFLGKELAADEIPAIKPMVIFANKNVDLTVENPVIPVMQTNQVRSFLRDQGKDRTVSAEQRRQLAELLGDQET